jgi:type VI secretion system secreted protein Hcp
VAPLALAALTPMAAKGAAVDYFLKLDGVEGESTDKAHSKEIVLDSFSFGMSQTLSAPTSTGGASVGKVTFSDTAITAKISKVSPQLYLNAAGGTRIKSALITVRRPNDRSGGDFYTVKLEDVLLTSLKTGGNSGDTPTETLTMNFGKVIWTYRPQKADGSLDTPVTKFWSLRDGKGG